MSCGVGHRLGLDLAGAQASSCSSDATPGLGTSHVADVALKRKKKKSPDPSTQSSNGEDFNQANTINEYKDSRTNIQESTPLITSYTGGRREK